MGKRSVQEVQGQASQPWLAFARHEPGAESAKPVVHVNFGVFTGRAATQAEIDRLAERLLDRVDHVTIVSETHHEIDTHSEASVHQIRIEVGCVDDATAAETLERWLIQRAELWARTCMAERTAYTA
jgi:hypothetical protein